jgi:Flp pilus assembly protein TadD
MNNVSLGKPVARGRAMAISLVALLAYGCAGAARKDSVSSPRLDEFRAVVAAGDAAMHASQYAAAAQAYLMAHRIDPANYIVSAKIGEALLAAGELESALANFETALVLQPDFAPALQGAGVVLTRQQRWSEALPLLKRAVANEPTLWRAHSALGISADALHEHELAAAHHARAIELRPDRLELHNNLGYSLYLAGRLEDAAARLWSALELDIENERAWRNLAMVRMKQDDMAGALRALREVESYHAALNDLGVMAEAASRYDEARRYYARAVAEAPDYERARRNLEALAVRQLAQRESQASQWDVRVHSN